MIDRVGDAAECSNEASPIMPEVSSDIPDIKPTLAKGQGLPTLKNSLSTLYDEAFAPDGDMGASTETDTSRARALSRQQQLEMNTYESAIERWREETRKLMELGINIALKNGPVSGLIWNWHQALTSRLKEEIFRANQAEKANSKKPDDVERCMYGPFLQILPVEKLSAVTILSCVNHLSTIRGHSFQDTTLNQALRCVGAAVEDECLLETIRKDGDHRLWRSLDKSDSVQKLNRLVRIARVESRYGKILDQGPPSDVRREGLRWTEAIRIKVAAVLVSHLLQAARIGVSSKDPSSGAEIRESQPAFLHYYRYEKGRRVGMLRFNKALALKMEKDPLSCALAKHLPMLVEPKPWVDFQKGAFLTHQVRVVRTHGNNDLMTVRYAQKASENGDMDLVFSSLDALSRTPWRINREVFKVMVAGWNSGEALGKITPENPNVDYPAEPSPEASESERREWLSRKVAAQNKEAGYHSQRCFTNFQLEVARAYLNEVFYFPHNVDFRGRAYPMVPFFNYMGADPARSLLKFANGKELGEKGLSWIKIHLASLYGLSKATFEERQKFTDDNISEVFDSATRPLDGNRWWLKADDPWQCLGACIELKAALQSPDPRRFVSHLPVHQDGTCNGLQHYAALGGDILGASQVNLEPGDRPSDIYNTVADMVRAEIVAEAAQGDKVAQVLQHSITRKVVKQTVMTTVYGVTFVGALRQIRRQLDNVVFPNRETEIAANVSVARKTLKMLSTLFSGATEIQGWLSDCAKAISRAVTPEQILSLRKPSEDKDKNSPLAKRALTGEKPKRAKDEQLFLSPVIWTSPLKMPIVQPYRENTTQFVRTCLQKISITAPKLTDPCHRRKQLQAFPPNFIHSLDASHMMLTVLKCNEVGLTFAAVHDSFWTHAGDVDTMNQILREAFIRLHSEDIIGRLRAEFVVRYKGCLQLLSIPRKSAAGQEIARWRRERKTGKTVEKNWKMKELLMEARRLDLLESDKPEERLEGESMVTPATIYRDANTKNGATDISDTDGNRRGQSPLEMAIEEEADAALSGPAEQLANDDMITDVNSLGIHETEEDELVEPTPPKRKTKAEILFWAPIHFPPVPKKVCIILQFARPISLFMC